MPGDVTEACFSKDGKWVYPQGWKKLGFQAYPKDADPTDPAVAKALKHNQRQMIKHIKKHGFDYAASVYWGNILEVQNDKLFYHNMEWVTKGENLAHAWKTGLRARR